MYKCSRLYKTGDGTHILNTPTVFKQTKNTTTFCLKSVLKGDVQDIVVWCGVLPGAGLAATQWRSMRAKHYFTVGTAVFHIPCLTLAFVPVTRDARRETRQTHSNYY